MSKICRNYREFAQKTAMMVLLCFVFSMLVVGLNGAPIMNERLRLVQPDGIVIDAFNSGDEVHSWVHDENGFTIIRDPITGFWTWARESRIRQGDIESTYIKITADTKKS